MIKEATPGAEDSSLSCEISFAEDPTSKNTGTPASAVTQCVRIDHLKL